MAATAKRQFEGAVKKKTSEKNTTKVLRVVDMRAAANSNSDERHCSIVNIQRIYNHPRRFKLQRHRAI